MTMSETVSRTTTPYAAMQYTGDNFAEVQAWLRAFGTRYTLHSSGGYWTYSGAAIDTIAAVYQPAADIRSRHNAYLEPTDWLVVTPVSVTASTDAQMRAFTSVAVG
jgi:hypothetical protein